MNNTKELRDIELEISYRDNEIKDAFKAEIQQSYEICKGILPLKSYRLKPKEGTEKDKKERYKLEVMLEGLNSTFISGYLDILLEGIEGKRVLDIGCGGTYDDAAIGFGFRFAYLCSFLKRLGADIAGIDPSRPGFIDFEYHPIKAKDIDSQFKEEEFDAVFTRMFWTAPSREEHIKQEFDVDFENSRFDKLLNRRNYEIMEKVHKVLKTGGIYISEFDYPETVIKEDAVRLYPESELIDRFEEIPLSHEHLILRKK